MGTKQEKTLEAKKETATRKDPRETAQGIKHKRDGGGAEASLNIMEAEKKERRISGKQREQKKRSQLAKEAAKQNDERI